MGGSVYKPNAVKGTALYILPRYLLKIVLTVCVIFSALIRFISRAAFRLMVREFILNLILFLPASFVSSYSLQRNGVPAREFDARPVGGVGIMFKKAKRGTQMEKEISDIAIIGCGPAGLSAAVNAGGRRKSVALFGGELCAPKMQKSAVVNNYLGSPNISGEILREKFLEHVKSMGIAARQVLINAVYQNSRGGFTLRAGEDEYDARAVVIASGVTVDKLIDGEREFTGKGVSYCATCDGPLFKGKDVAVVAYTGEGAEDANFLKEFCRRVYFIPAEKKALEGLKDGIEVVEAKNIQAVTGGGGVTGLVADGRELAVQGVFIYRETYLPDTLVPGLAVRENHITVDRALKTNIEGVFAAGDCTGKPYQLAKAVGEGQVAALSAVNYLDSAAK